MNENIINQVITEDYSIYHADTVEVAQSLPDGSTQILIHPSLCDTLTYITYIGTDE